MEKLITFITSLSIPAMIGLSFLGSIVFLFAWSTYSSKRRESLKKGKFAVMEIVSESRETYGDSSKIPGIARRFSRASITDIRRSFVQIAGDIFAPGSRKASIRMKGDTAFQYSADGKKVAMYGRKEPTNLSLRELVSEKSAMMEIEEDVFKRMNWAKEIAECVPIKDQKDSNVEGQFSFCYRDYVNHEELMGMMWKRGGIEGFLFKPSCADVLTVDKDNKCTLKASSKLFRLIPISITWEGKLEEGVINWTTTSMVMGWESFGKFFDKPAAAEKLRKDPWLISTLKDDSTRDILCFDRQDKGNLVFAKPECLRKGIKSQ